MEIDIKKNYDKQIGNVRVNEIVYSTIEMHAEQNDVSMGTIVRAILEQAVKDGIKIKD